jgi:hypothetical protein
MINSSSLPFGVWELYFLIAFCVLLGGIQIASFIIHLYNLTLIDLKFIFLIGAVGMIALPILLKDMSSMIAKWSWSMESRYISLVSEKDYINQMYFIFLFLFFPVIGFGLFLSTFLYFNLNLSTPNITEKIQAPILEVRITYNSSKYGDGAANGKKATVKIKNYIKAVRFPLEAEIKEGQFLNFSVRKGYFGFDVIEKR